MTANCVSYENVMGSLREISGSIYVDPVARATAKQTVEFLGKNPKTAKLLEEGLSNASCSDIAQVVQSLGAGVRDVTIALSAMKLNRELSDTMYEISKAAGQFEKAARTTTETVGYAGREIGNIYHRFDKGVKDVAYVSLALAVAALIAGGIFVGRKLYKSGRTRTG